MDAEQWRAQMVEKALDPELPVIDAHHHIWPEVFAPGFEAYTDDALLADVQTSGHNIIATVAVEAWGSYRPDGPVELRPVGETEHAQAMADRVPGLCAGIVAHADLLLGDAVVPVLEAHFAAAPDRLRGIRHITASDPDMRTGYPSPPGLMPDPAFRAGLRHLARRQLSFDIWAVHPQLGEVLDLVRAFPNTLFILDHLGGPLGIGRFSQRRAEAFAEWRAALAPLAACENLTVKLGGLNMPTTGMNARGLPCPRSSEEMAALHRDHILTAIDLFGPARAMFESNFPVDRLSTPYGVLWNAFKRITAGFTKPDREALFAGTARRVYRLAGK
jgi:predicted TIM-barrel fold metal-dependent hydrolase